MIEWINLGEFDAEVVKKDIKNVHLSVYPPNGMVRISAPVRMSMDTIRAFAITKLDWIKRQQQKMFEQERETPRENVDRESHYVWGKRYLLKVMEAEAAPKIDLEHSTMVLRIRPGTEDARKQEIVAEWYRSRIKEVVPPIIAKWEKILGVKVQGIFVQGMKTRWGSCNHKTAYIRLNTELAKKPPECLEYVLVHEMVHILEPTHNPQFIDLMDQHLPNWRHLRDNLNRLPLRHENWKY